MTQPELGAKTAIAMITASLRHDLSAVAGRTPAETADYARDITTLLEPLNGVERLLTIAYLIDLARSFAEALAKERGQDVHDLVQDVALIIAESGDGPTIDE